MKPTSVLSVCSPGSPRGAAISALAPEPDTARSMGWVVVAPLTSPSALVPVSAPALTPAPPPTHTPGLRRAPGGRSRAGQVDLPLSQRPAALGWLVFLGCAGIGLSLRAGVIAAGTQTVACGSSLRCQASPELYQALRVRRAYRQANGDALVCVLAGALAGFLMTYSLREMLHRQLRAGRN